MKNYSHRHQYFRRLILSFISVTCVLVLFIEKVESHTQTHNKHGISILISKNSLQYQRVINSIQNKLNENRINEPLNIIVLTDKQKLRTINFDNKKLVVLIGSRALDYYLKSNAKSPYISSLITRSAYSYINASKKINNKFIGGVSIDQPARRFVSLAKMIVPDLKKAALVMGPEVIKNKSSFLKNIDKFKLVYSVIEILLNDNPVNKLRRAYSSNQVLILFPDKKKFNSSLSRWILTLSYQYKIPVVSYSKKYAQAGALASIFSTTEQVGYQTAEMMSSYLKNPRNKPAKLVDPKYFDIYVNKSVESALNLKIPSKLELLKKIPN